MICPSWNDPSISSEMWHMRRQQRSAQVNTLLTCALLVIAILGTVQVLPAVSVAGSIMGLSIGLFLTTLCGGKKPVDEDGDDTDRRCKILFDSILAIALTALSALVLRGIVSPTHLSWAAILPISIWSLSKCCACTVGILCGEQNRPPKKGNLRVG